MTDPIYHNSQRMSDSFYHIIESRELNFKVWSTTYSFGHLGQPVLEFLRRIHTCMYSAIYDVMKSYLPRV